MINQGSHGTPCYRYHHGIQCLLRPFQVGRTPSLQPLSLLATWRRRIDRGQTLEYAGLLRPENSIKSKLYSINCCELSHLFV